MERRTVAEAKARHDRGIAKNLKHLLLVLAVSFALSLCLFYRVYHVLDREIATLKKEITRNSTSGSGGGHNITKLLNMTEASNEIAHIKAQLKSQKKDMKLLNHVVNSALKDTVAELNTTIEGVQKEVNNQVQLVNENVNSQNSLMAYQFAGTFAILGTLISGWHISNHLRSNNEPTVQRKIVAILWMIPIFSMTSWLGLVMVSVEGYLGLIKDFYEAYCIYTFLSFLISVLGRGDRESVIDLLAEHANHLNPPIHLLFWKDRRTFESPRHKAEAVLMQCQLFAMQFVFVRPVTSLLLLICDAIKVSRWDWHYPQFYLMMMVNISVFFAFTGLVKIYHAIRDELAWCHPFSKFLCIKGVVFMTFWQGVVISISAQAIARRRMSEDDDWDATEWGKQAQSFLVCLEMFFFAVIHCFVFPTEEWEEGYKEKEVTRVKSKFGDNLALRDFFRDVKLVMNKKKKQRKRASKMNAVSSDGNETTFGDSREDVALEVDIDWTRDWGQIEKCIGIFEDGNMGEDEDGSESSSTKSNEREDKGKSALNIV